MGPRAGSGRRRGAAAGESLAGQRVEAYASHCRSAITLHGRGQLEFDGAVPSRADPDQFSAVTGGTGEFRGYGGELVISFPSDELRPAHAEVRAASRMTFVMGPSGQAPTATQAGDQQEQRDSRHGQGDR